MKYCPNCGTAMQDDARFCVNCGTVSGTPSAGAQTQPPVTSAPTPPVSTAPKKSQKGLITTLWITIVALVLILAIVVSSSLGLFDGLFDGFGSDTSIRNDEDDNDNDRKPADSDPTTPTDPPQPTDPTSPANPTDPTEPADPEPPKQEIITIKVWTPYEDQSEYNNWLAAMETDFLKANPQYTYVQFENACISESDAGDAVIADSLAAADVYMFANDQMGRLILAGGLAKLDANSQSQVISDNSEFMINTVTYTDGCLYGFPTTGNTWYMYYDKAVFTEEDIQNLDTMLEKGKVYLPMSNAWTAGCFFLGTGCTVFGESGRDADAGIDFGGDKGYKAAHKMVELRNNANVICGDLDISKMIIGEVSATFSGSWVRSEMEAAFGDRLGVAMLPKFTIDGEDYQMTALSGSKCIGVNPNADYVDGKLDICMEFAAFLASEEAQLARYEMRGVIPVHKDLQEHEAIKADAVATAEVNTLTMASAIQSYLPEMSYYWSPLDRFGRMIAAGDITMDVVEIAVEDMVTAMNDF